MWSESYVVRRSSRQRTPSKKWADMEVQLYPKRNLSHTGEWALFFFQNVFIYLYLNQDMTFGTNLLLGRLIGVGVILQSNPVISRAVNLRKPVSRARPLDPKF